MTVETLPGVPGALTFPHSPNGDNFVLDFWGCLLWPIDWTGESGGGGALMTCT